MGRASKASCDHGTQVTDCTPEGAAGIAGLIKIVTTVRHVCSAPNLQLEATNPRLALRNLAVGMPSQTQSNVSFSAGVSSFGFSGTNSHAVVLLNYVQRQQLAVLQQVAIPRYQHTDFVWWDSSVTAAVPVTLLGLSTTTLETGSETQWERSWPSTT